MLRLTLAALLVFTLVATSNLPAGEKGAKRTAKIVKVEKVKLTGNETAYKIVLDKGTKDGVAYGTRYNFSTKTINKLIVTEIGEKTATGMIEASKVPGELKKGMVLTEHEE